MTWDNETCFYEYQEGATYLLKKLGITQLDHIKTKTLEVLYPYYNQIIKYLNKELMCNCEDTIKAKIQKILDIADHGARLINTREDQPIWNWDPEEVEVIISDGTTDLPLYEETGQPIKYTITKNSSYWNLGESQKIVFTSPNTEGIKITLTDNHLRDDQRGYQRVYYKDSDTGLNPPYSDLYWDSQSPVDSTYTSETGTLVLWYYSEYDKDPQQTLFFTVTVENNESEPPQPKEKTRTLELAEEVGIDYESDLYIQDRFVFSWADLLGTLCLRLKFQYAHLFKQEVDDTCGCNCGRGQTEEDYESWVSGVYPEDYEYDRTNYYRTNTNWGTTEDRICDCYKKNL